jgi:hypothetical protein
VVWYIYADISAEQTQAYSEQNDKNLLIPPVKIKISNSIGKLEAASFFENFIRKNYIDVHNKGC